jgi:ubiquitin carboxyl-terminal hydrolase 4/11/15
MDDDDDEQLPGYGEVVAKSSLHPSIEDEGVDMTDSDPAQSNPIIQGWSFSGISGNGREGSTGADIGSDDVQHGSTDDERMGPQNFDDQDVEMASVTAELDSQEQLSVADGNAQTSWNRKDIISVPAKTGSDRDSDEVAEIHIEGESRGPLAN